MEKSRKVALALPILLSLYAICLNAQTSFFIGPMASGQVSKYKVSGDYLKHYSYAPEVIDFAYNDGSYAGSTLYWNEQKLNQKSILGLSGGVTIGMQFSRFAIISGLRFFQKGTKLESRDFDYYDWLGYDFFSDSYEYNILDRGTYTQTERQNFIHIPILARYQIFGDRFGATLALGPTFNLGVGNAIKSWEFEGKLTGANITTTTGEEANSYGKDLDNLYKPMQMGFLISPGVVFPVGEKGKLCLTLNWETDFSSSINSNYEKKFTSPNGYIVTQKFDGSLRNKSFGIGISYEHHLEFKLGTKY